MTPDALRKRWKAHWRKVDEIRAQARARGLLPGQYSTPRLPDELREMSCGAKTRAGTACKLRDLYSNGRCKFHGGLATGPTSEAGRDQARINGKKGGRPRKATEPESEAHAHGKDQVRGESVVCSSAAAGNAKPKASQAPVPMAQIPSIETEAHGMLKDVDISKAPPAARLLSDIAISGPPEVRCAYCSHLAPEGVCLAARRGEIPGGASLRPSVSDPRRCTAFKDWKT
jgi:hypothetical protein